MDSELHTLSSAQTFVMKYVFPTVWIGGFALATLSLFLTANSWHDTEGGPTDTSLKWIFLVVTILGTAFIWWASVRLKRVRMDANSLYISNFSTEIVVPLANVSEVTENRWVNGHPVTIHFHSDTKFGSEVMFLPKIRWFDSWSSHPVVDEIKRAVERATGRNRP